MPSLKPQLVSAIAAAVRAGRAILDIYDHGFEVVYKEDRSPLTAADRAAHKAIDHQLQTDHPQLPILSEEGRQLPYAQRKRWPRFWLVDPLDGTKEFIKRNGEFTVNIALVSGTAPVLGVIYAPVRDRLYFAADKIGAFRLSRAAAVTAVADWDTEPAAILATICSSALPLPVQDPLSVFTIVGSRSHGSADFDAYVARMRRRHGDVRLRAAGSALKICLVAEGSADVYPRLGPTMEWDTAAGQAIVEQSGGRMVQADSGKPLGYNKPDLLNPWFIVTQKDTQ